MSNEVLYKVNTSSCYSQRLLICPSTCIARLQLRLGRVDCGTKVVTFKNPLPFHSPVLRCNGRRLLFFCCNHWRPLVPSLFPRRSWVFSCDLHVDEQLRIHGLAGHPVQRRDGRPVHDGVLPRQGRVEERGRPVLLVRAPLGPHPLLHGRVQRGLHLRHRRLWLRQGGVLRRRGGSSGHPGRVHSRRKRRHGLLRREPRRRLQRSHAGGAPGRHDLGGQQLQLHGLSAGPQRTLPFGPQGGAVDLGRRQRGRGVQERVRGLRLPSVLLQRRVREPQHLPAVVLLPVLQERVSPGVQLRLRRRHLHLHLRRRRQLRHHILSLYHQSKVGRRQPGGGAAYEQNDGLLRRPGDQRRVKESASFPRPRRCVGHRLRVVAPLPATTMLSTQNKKSRAYVGLQEWTALRDRAERERERRYYYSTRAAVPTSHPLSLSNVLLRLSCVVLDETGERFFNQTII